MLSEIHQLSMPGHIFVFIAIRDEARLVAAFNVLKELGAIIVGPRSLAIGKEVAAPEAIRDALGELTNGDCVYLVSGERLDYRLLARPKIDASST